MIIRSGGIDIYYAQEDIIFSTSYSFRNKRYFAFEDCWSEIIEVLNLPIDELEL